MGKRSALALTMGAGAAAGNKSKAKDGAMPKRVMKKPASSKRTKAKPAAKKKECHGIVVEHAAFDSVATLRMVGSNRCPGLEDLDIDLKLGQLKSGHVYRMMVEYYPDGKARFSEEGLPVGRVTDATRLWNWKAMMCSASMYSIHDIVQDAQ